MLADFQKVQGSEQESNDDSRSSEEGKVEADQCKNRISADICIFFSWHPCLELFFLCFRTLFKLQVFKGVENIISATSQLFKVIVGAQDGVGRLRNIYMEIKLQIHINE